MASKRRWRVLNLPCVGFPSPDHKAEDMPASSVLRRASRTEAGWLARFARERAEQEREALELGIERELQVRQLLCSCSFGPALMLRSAQSVCPPREVRSFRVLLMRDARATRRPARRVVEMTAWDVLSLAFDGAPEGQFKEGQAFQVSFALICLTELSELRMGLTFFFLLSFPFFLILGHEFTSDTEECVDGPQRGGRTRVPQHE